MSIKRFFIAFVLVFGIAFFIFSRVVVGWSPFDETPITVPIDLSKAGSVVEIKLNVWEKLRYAFRLEFSKASEGDTRVDVKKIEEFIGRDFYDPKTKVGGKTGIPIPIKITIYKIGEQDTPVLIFDEAFTTRGHEYLIYHHEIVPFLGRRVTALDLARGHYLIRVESLENFPELTGWQMYVRIIRPNSF